MSGLYFTLRKDMRLSRKPHNRIDNMHSQYSRDLTSGRQGRLTDGQSRFFTAAFVTVVVFTSLCVSQKNLSSQ